MNKKSYGANIGFSSILITIIILCLVSFAALSQVSANADYRLSKKLADRTTAYYEACNTANEWLQTINTQLTEIYTQTDSEASFLEQSAANQIADSCSFPISDTQTLCVEIAFDYPTTDSSFLYHIIKWQTITTQSPELDQSLPLLQPES